MGWVEELKPDDDVTVEIIYPNFYVNYAVETMPRFSEAASLHCKAAALLGKDSVKFTIPGITIIQCISLKEVLAQFGVKMKYEPPRAKWKLGGYGKGTCSRCNFTQACVWDFDHYQRFCGVCGAEMELEDAK